MKLEKLMKLEDHELLYRRMEIIVAYEKLGRRNRRYFREKFDRITNILNNRGYELNKFGEIKDGKKD